MAAVSMIRGLHEASCLSSSLCSRELIQHVPSGIMAKQVWLGDEFKGQHIHSRATVFLAMLVLAIWSKRFAK